MIQPQQINYSYTPGVQYPQVPHAFTNTAYAAPPSVYAMAPPSFLQSAHAPMQIPPSQVITQAPVVHQAPMMSHVVQQPMQFQQPIQHFAHPIQQQLHQPIQQAPSKY